MRRFETRDVADLSATGDQIGQTEHVLRGQWPGGLCQRLADSSVQSGVGNGNFLCEERGRETGENQQRQHTWTFDGSGNSHNSLFS